MKEIKREIKHEVVDTIYRYVAADGTEFSSKDECKKYEESALGVMRSRIQEYKVGESIDEWTIMGGMDDHIVTAFKLPSEGALNTFLQWLFLECPWYLSENKTHTEEKVRIEGIIKKAHDTNDVILIGQNCDGDYYFINSRQNIIDNFMKFTNEK